MITRKQADYILEKFDAYGWVNESYDNIAGRNILEKVLDKCIPEHIGLLDSEGAPIE